MPGTLKLNTVASVYYYSHKPYNWVRSFTSVTGTSNSSIAAALSVSTHTRRYWWGTSIPVSSDFRRRRKFVGLLGQGYAVRSISTIQMGPTPDNKEEDFRREKVSLPQSPSSKSEKLLTLPTILTIGRVAAVPLLVTKVCSGDMPERSLVLAIVSCACHVQGLSSGRDRREARQSRNGERGSSEKRL
ncbi:hypothetical protein BC332_30762 [Capsicum chinense]|nr:hypothetical protein BC332_30762 [Capsicum chinense]